MEGLDLIKKIFKDQPKGIYSLSWKQGSAWGDEFFKTLKDMEKWLKNNTEKRDLYFCTTTLSAPKRKKFNVLPSRYLWQDLDEVDPRKITPKPTIAWESSPNRYQALWKLDKHYKPEEIEYINKALAKKVNADQGSWILTKVLRIPGTHNYKYEDAPLGKLLWKKGKTYSKKEIANFTEPLSISSDQIMDRHRDKIPQRVQRLLTAEEVSVGSRSDTLWYIEHELAKCGIPLDEIYALIKNSAWNKFKGRSDEQTRLTNEISKAFGDEMITDSSIPSSKFGFNFDKLSPESDTDLMSNLGLYPGWLIKNFWTRKSHGIVAGEPKSFKSTLVMDMMVSVASGEPFLGEFEVMDKGPVLMVQNENAAWIMKDRLSKIRASKGLIGNIKKRGKGKYGVKFPKELPIYYINQQGFSLSNDSHKQMLEELLEEIKPRLLILDPLYLMFSGDINSARELNPILAQLLYLKEKYDLSIILVHHWGKSKNSNRGGQRMLGSTTLHGWIESAWYLSVVGASAEEDIPEGDSADVDIPSSSSSLIMEREFRGAGKYPLTAITVEMGEFNSDEYSIKVGVANKDKIKLTDEQLKNEVLDFISLKGKATMDELIEATGVTGRVLIDCCKSLIYDKRLIKSGSSYKLGK